MFGRGGIRGGGGKGEPLGNIALELGSETNFLVFALSSMAF